jgi:molybdopterin converting factor small subunit
MAISIKIRYLAVLKGLSDPSERPIDLNSDSLGELLDHLQLVESNALKSRLFAGGSALRADVIVFINGVDSMLLGSKEAKLKDGDEVTFLPSVHGG